MVAAEQENNTELEQEFRAWLTDPDQEIWISEDTDVFDNYPTKRLTTYRRLFESTSMPSETDFEKDGQGWYNGVCVGRRIAPNFSTFDLAVFDADKSIDKDGKIVDGAPDINEVHEFLKGVGLTHHIYTTFSHGGIKGNRYRIVFPLHSKNPSELRGFLLYVTELMQVAGIRIFLTNESYRIPNRWHYPRVETRDSPFYALTYWGNTVSPVFLARHYHQVDATGKPVHANVPCALPRVESTGSLISRFCHFLSVPQVIEAYGYTFRGQQILIDQDGHETTALRYLPPDSGSAPGVIVFDSSDKKQRVYSHHTNDPLACEFALDAYDAYMLLNNVPEHLRLKTASEVVTQCEINWMNTTYPYMPIGNHSVFAKRTHDPVSGGMSYRFMSPTDFKMEMPQVGPVYATEEKTVENGTVSNVVSMERVSWWINHPKKINYNGTFFYPLSLKESIERGEIDHHRIIQGQHYYNMFTGWSIEPKPGNCDLIKWHIKHALCSGDEDHYWYIIQWLAHIFQYPAEKPRVALAFTGGKGIGKSLFTQSLIQALAPMGVSIGNPKNLSSQFNAVVINKLLVVLEESFFAGNPEDDGILKNMITDSSGVQENKHQDAKIAMTYYRVIINTNHASAVPATDKERRYFVPVTSDAAIQRNCEENNSYFYRLKNELFGPGMKAFVHELMNTKVDLINISSPPDSIELQRQKIYALKGAHSWLADSLKMGFLLTEEGRSIRLEAAPRRTAVSVRDLLSSMAGYGARHEHTKAKLFEKLAQVETVTGRLIIEQRADDGYVTLPPLEEMRQAFERQYRLSPGWLGG